MKDIWSVQSLLLQWNTSWLSKPCLLVSISVTSCPQYLHTSCEDTFSFSTFMSIILLPTGTEVRSMISSSSPSLSVSLSSSFTFKSLSYFKKPYIHWSILSEEVGVSFESETCGGVVLTFGSVAVSLSRTRIEEASDSTLRFFTRDWRLTLWFPWNFLFFVYSTLCFRSLGVFHEKQYCSHTHTHAHKILLKTHSKHSDGSSSGWGRNYYFTVHSLGERDARYLSDTAIIGMGTFFADLLSEAVKFDTWYPPLKL